MDCVNNWKLNKKCDPPECKLVYSKKNTYCRKSKNNKKTKIKNQNIIKKNNKKLDENIKIKSNTCTKRNPIPPCIDGYIIKKNKNGHECCYKDTKKVKKKNTKKVEEKDTKKVEEKDTKKVEEKDTKKVEEKDTKKVGEKDTKKVEEKDKEMEDILTYLPDEYEILNKLGKGRFATVYKIKKKNNYYALRYIKGKKALSKLLNFGKNGGGREIEFQVVASILEISPKIYEIYISPKKNSALIIMQYIDGYTLDKVEKKIHIDIDIKKHIFHRAIDLIKKLHRIKWNLQKPILDYNIYELPKLNDLNIQLLSQEKADLEITNLILNENENENENNYGIGIFHSDLNKLDNIMYDEINDKIYIIDYGLSNVFSERLLSDIQKSKRVDYNIIKKKITFWKGFDLGHVIAKMNKIK